MIYLLRKIISQNPQSATRKWQQKYKVYWTWYASIVRWASGVVRTITVPVVASLIGAERNCTFARRNFSLKFKINVSKSPYCKIQPKECFSLMEEQLKERLVDYSITHNSIEMREGQVTN